MARPRKTYTAEFKIRAVQLVTGQKLSVAEAARRLGVHVVDAGVEVRPRWHTGWWS